MYSWNAVRTVCAVLLLIPIVHLAYLMSRETMASLNASPEAWADEIASYTTQDQASQLPAKPILVTGGRQVKLWRGLEDLLSPRPVLMRGLGDATVDDITHYHDELIGYYRPSALVLLPGPSEFHIRDNKSPEQLVDAIRKLVELDKSYKVVRSYYIFSPIKTPLYPQDYSRIDQVTRLLEQWALETSQVSILDPNKLLADASGRPNPDFFRLDGTNLNEHGYLRISLLLEDHLEPEQGEPLAAGSKP